MLQGSRTLLLGGPIHADTVEKRQHADGALEAITAGRHRLAARFHRGTHRKGEGNADHQYSRVRGEFESPQDRRHLRSTVSYNVVGSGEQWELADEPIAPAAAAAAAAAAE